MNIWQIGLLVLAVVAGLVAVNKKRAFMWVGLMVLAFSAAVAWQRLGLPNLAFVNVILDTAICLVIYHVGKYKWEMVLYKVFAVSVFISTVKLVGFPANQSQYIMSLEACNAVALLVIGWPGIVDWIKRHGNRFNTNFMRALCLGGSSLCEKRTDTRWYEV